MLILKTKEKTGKPLRTVGQDVYRTVGQDVYRTVGQDVYRTVGQDVYRTLYKSSLMMNLRVLLP